MLAISFSSAAEMLSAAARRQQAPEVPVVAIGVLSLTPATCLVTAAAGGARVQERVRQLPQVL